MSERRRIIEGTWNCTSCEATAIPGAQKVCPTCGNPREDEEAKFNFGALDASGKSSNLTVDQADALALATAGADWYCANCGTANRGNVEACKSCGTNEAGSRLAKKPAKLLHDVGPPAPPLKKKGASTTVKAIGCLFMGGLVAVLVTFMVIGIATFWTSESQGTVTGMEWTRDITVETYTPVTGKKGWRTDLGKRASTLPAAGKGGDPGADNVRECIRKEKTPKKCEQKTKQVQCGTQEKCEQKDLGNGFAEEVCKDVPKMCDEKYEECKEAVVDDWCTYDTYEWKAGPKSTMQGTDANPVWPAVPALSTLDREITSEKFTVNISYEGETTAYEPKNEAEYLQFKPDMPVVVTLNGLGSVQSVAPAP